MPSSTTALRTPTGAEMPTREAMRALFAHVSEHCDLPPLPAVAARATVLVRDPNAKADDLARLVATDAAIAARVLRVSRSAVYTRLQPPRTLQEAITTVGFDVLRRILVVASARTAYRPNDKVAQSLWEHALATALAADELAVLAGGQRGGSDFIAGLLHDVGKLVFHLSAPRVFAGLTDDDEAMEADLFGVTHAAVGACLAEQWGLDDDVVGGIMSHHRSNVAEISAMGARLAEADEIVLELECETPAPDTSRDEQRVRVAARVADLLASERTLFD